MKQVLGLQGWRGDTRDRRICWLCNASLHSGDCYAFDFRKDLAWKQEPPVMPTFWARACFAHSYVSSLFSVPGFSVDIVAPDLMHTGCLGCLQYLLAHVFYELFRSLGGVEGNAVKSREVCAILMNSVRAMARELNMEPPFNHLVVTMFKPSGKAPKMHVKAAEARYALPVMYKMLLHCFPLTTAHEQLSMQCVRAMHETYETMYQWKPDGSSAARLEHVGRTFLILYGELVKYAGWEMYPKFHLFEHIISGRFINPMDEWNYCDESEIGLAAAMSARCHPCFLRKTVMQRYRNRFRHA